MRARLIKKLIIDAAHGFKVLFAGQLIPTGGELHEYRNAHRGQFLQTTQNVDFNQFKGRIGSTATATFKAWFSPFQISAIYTCIRPHGEILGEIPLAIDAERLVVPDPLPFRLPGKSSLRAARLSLAVQSESASAVASLVHPYSSNYFHWFMDFLPMLRELDLTDTLLSAKATVIVPSGMTEWQQRSLQLLAPNRRFLLHRTRRGRFRVSAAPLVVPSSPRFNGCSQAPFAAQDPSVLMWLRQKLCLSPSGRPGRGRRLLIQREHSRKILFDAAVVKMLRDHGFQIVSLEGLTLDFQRELFSDAEFVIASHGSGLTNLLFSASCSVVELFPQPHGVRADYFQIAVLSGHRYECVICETADPQHNVVLNATELRKIMKWFEAGL